MRPTRFLVAALLIPLATVFAQNPRPKGKINDTYAQLCANCHGKNLEGGQAQSMLDDVWTAGGDDESLARSIRNGFPEKGMPAWGAAIPEKEIRAMVIYLREQRALHQRGLLKFPGPVESATIASQLHTFQMDTWIGNV